MRRQSRPPRQIHLNKVNTGLRTTYGSSPRLFERQRVLVLAPAKSRRHIGPTDPAARARSGEAAAGSDAREDA